MQGIVERKTTIPVLSHLLLTAREDRLNLAATDLDVSLTSWSAALPRVGLRSVSPLSPAQTVHRRLTL